MQNVDGQSHVLIAFSFNADSLDNSVFERDNAGAAFKQFICSR